VQIRVHSSSARIRVAQHPRAEQRAGVAHESNTRDGYGLVIAP
jgi:hypothetical protein